MTAIPDSILIILRDLQNNLGIVIDINVRETKMMTGQMKETKLFVVAETAQENLQLEFLVMMDTGITSSQKTIQWKFKAKILI